MAFALIVEDGSGVEGANSYAAVSVADTYHASSGDGAIWGELTLEQKGILLVRSTRTIDALCQYPGYPVKAGQALRWPRSGVVVDGWALDPSKLPTPLVNAVCELAGVLASNEGEDVTAEDATAALKGITVGTVKIDFRDTSAYPTSAAKVRDMLPSNVYALLLPLLADASVSAPLPVRLVRS